MALVVSLAPEFKRQFKKLVPALQEEILEKIDLFKEPANHRALRVQKLHGPLQRRYSFSINYQYRVIFMYYKKSKEVILLSVGDHSVYQ